MFTGSKNKPIVSQVGAKRSMASISSRLLLDIPLAGVVTSANVAIHNKSDVYRRYTGTVTSKMVLNHAPDVHTRTNVFQIGARSFDDAESLLVVVNDLKLRMSQSFMLRAELASEVEGLARKYSNFSNRFTYMDLSGLACQLARGLAVFSQTQELSGYSLRGGKAISVRVLGTMTDPVSAPGGGLFIPRIVDEMGCGVFAALVCAANAYGVTPYTDHAAVDGNNSPVVQVPSDATLALACVQALRILLTEANECGAGSIIALAITKGIHSVVSVVGHSDEGGYMRDTLRRLDFCAPYGAVYAVGAKAFMGLPMPSVASVATFIALTDSIALLTAACSSISDPLVQLDGEYYPTVSVYREGDFVEAGGAPEASAERLAAAGLAHGQFYATTCGRFCSNYAANLAKAFCVSGGEDQASDALQLMFMSFDRNTPSRHTSMISCSVYYWIEPTGMFRHAWETSANSHSYGTVVGTDECSERRCFERCQVTTSGNVSNISVSWRSMRTNALIVHLTSHQLDGTANFRPIQFLSDKVANIGGQSTAAANRSAGRGLNDYAWGKWQTTMPHPAEMMYTGARMGMAVSHYTYDERLSLTITHAPTCAELLDGVITFSASRLTAVEPGNLGPVSAERRHERSRAMEALTCAAQGMYRTAATGGEAIAVGDFEPIAWDPEPETVVGGPLPSRGEVDVVGDNVEAVGEPMPHVYAHSTAKVRIAQPQNVKHSGGARTVEQELSGGGNEDEVREMNEFSGPVDVFGGFGGEHSAHPEAPGQ